MSDFEYDPDRALWKPGRRSFLFMFGAALVASMRPEPKLQEFVADHDWGYGTTGYTILRKGDVFTISGVYSVNAPMAWIQKPRPPVRVFS